MENDAYISSEIPFVIQDRSLSGVLKMEWDKKPRTHEDAEVYRDNLSKLLAIRVMLGLCNGDIHSAWFALLCTRQNISSLSSNVREGLDGLDSDALVDVSSLIEKVVLTATAPSSKASFRRVMYSMFRPSVGDTLCRVIGVSIDSPASTVIMSPANLPLTQPIYSTLRSSDVDVSLSPTQPTAAAAHGEQEESVMPRIEFSRGFFESCIRELRRPESQSPQVG